MPFLIKLKLNVNKRFEERTISEKFNLLKLKIEN